MRDYLYKYKWYILMDVVCSSLYTISIGAIPIVSQQLLDSVGHLTMLFLIQLILFYVLFVVLGMFFQYFSQYFSWLWTSKIERDLRECLMDKILNANYQEYGSYKKEEYLSVFSNDIQAISDQYFLRVIDLIKSSLMVFIYGMYMVYFLNFGIAIVIIIASLLTLLTPNLTSRRLSENRLTYMNRLGTLTNVVSDVLSGFSLTNRQTKPNVMDYFKKETDTVQTLEVRYGFFKAFSIVLNGLFMYLLDISAFCIVGVMLLLGKISVGTATAALSYIKQFVYPIRYIIDDINEMNAVKKVIIKYRKLVDRQTKIKKRTSFNTNIHFEDANIVFEDFQLSNLTYTFENHRKYLLIGPSGSGKSTILGCLAGQVCLTSGKLLLDGKDMRALELTDVLGGVYAGNHIYDASVLENITMFGTYDTSRSDMYLKEHPNQKIEFLLKQPDARVLSNGEKQMVALLRAYLAHTPVVLLDEAFSAIDVVHRPYFMHLFLNDPDPLVIMITHDYDDDLKNRFDAILNMDNGHLIKKVE